MKTDPSPKQIKDALKDALGDDVRFVKGASTRGRWWSQHPNGLAGHIFHHTANPHATGDRGAPSLRYCINANGELPFCNAVVGRGGVYYVLALGSCWHSGYGGPWPSRGFRTAGDNYSAKAFWGVEIDDPGKGKTITPAQIKSASLAALALSDLVGWDPYALVTHGDWTDAGPYLMNPRGRQESGFGPYRGRKNDTNREFYSGRFWRDEVAKRRRERLPKVDADKLAAAIAAKQPHPDVVLVAQALSKQGFGGFRQSPVWGTGKRTAYSKWQRAVHVPRTGVPTRKDLELLAERTETFQVV